ncbi:hypothetical protein HDV04_001542 [Boothiomyces sp. JEL0838]|nr:hypothetical protein HDV04_001542 [Boothiomyces sp. JEL0838]
MGAGASLPELKDKDLEKLAKKNGLSKEGVKFFYNHYAVLQAKIKDPADMENRWMIEKLFDDLFPEREALTFGQYLETLMKFRSQSVDERAEFYFRILNYDKDKEVFYKSSAAVLKAFDATGGITFDQFKQKVVEDKWLNSRVMFDPVKPEYLK